MKRKRLYIILTVLLVIALGLFFLNLRSSDNTRPLLDDVFNNNASLVELSKVASDGGSVNALKAVASTISATAASDNQQLATYYQERYGKAPKAIKLAEADSPAGKLKATEAGGAFDSYYTEQASQLLESNLSILQSVQSQTNRASLLQLIEQLVKNQRSGLEQLQQLP